MCDVVGVVVCRFFLSLLISVGFAGAPPWGVSAPDLAMGTCSGVLPPRGRTLVRARAKVGCSGAADSLFVAIRRPWEKPSLPNRASTCASLAVCCSVSRKVVAPKKARPICRVW